VLYCLQAVTYCVLQLGILLRLWPVTAVHVPYYLSRETCSQGVVGSLSRDCLIARETSRLLFQHVQHPVSYFQIHRLEVEVEVEVRACHPAKANQGTFSHNISLLQTFTTAYDLHIERAGRCRHVIEIFRKQEEYILTP
jgi:hypothetical protein